MQVCFWHASRCTILQGWYTKFHLGVVVDTFGDSKSFNEAPNLIVHNLGKRYLLKVFVIILHRESFGRIIAWTAVTPSLSG
jgi:hypothetical protein